MKKIISHIRSTINMLRRRKKDDRQPVVTRKVETSGTITYSRIGDGYLHRIDGPAIIGHNGFEAWYHAGKRHRDDGPAITWADGSKEWYRNGVRYDPDE